MAYKYFKDSQNNVYAFEADGSQDAYIKPDLVAITEEEADAIRCPAPAAPSKILMAQAHLALLQKGYLNQVESIIAARGRAAQIEWNLRQTVERNHPLVSAIAAQLPLTEVQLDELFTLAATL